MLPILRKLKFSVAVFGSALLGQTQMPPPTPAPVISVPVVQPVPQGPPPEEDAGFQGYVQLLAARARSDHVRESTIQTLTSGLTLNRRVIELDRAQPGTFSAGRFPAVAPYLREHVDAARIARGRAKRAEVTGFAPQIEQQYGVPLPILLAIWGHETDYGSIRGNFYLPQALATLAYEGRRRELFADEFVAVLKMADRGVPRRQLVGSWAGAFGNPQFLPSMYLRLAVDGDGDGVANIWDNSPDTLASIGNYFRDAGWRSGQPWGVRATIPDSFDRSSVSPRLNAPSCSRVHSRHNRWLTVAEWRQLGIQPQAPIADDVMASLFEPDGPGTAAWLLTGNYRVILHYNCSNFYALSVGLLADEIAR